MGKNDLVKIWTNKFPRHAWALSKLPPRIRDPLKLSISIAGGLGKKEMTYLWKKAQFLESLPADPYNGQMVQDENNNEIWVYMSDKGEWEC